MATIKDVAALARVSQGTVSRYLHDKSLKPATRERVKNAIEELNYKVNMAARSLRSNKSYTIGVLSPYITSNFTPPILEAIEKYFAKKGYGLVICFSMNDKEIEQNRLNFLLDKRVDGIVLFPSEVMLTNIEPFKQARKDGIHMVAVDSYIEGLECDSVMFNNTHATYEACELFLRNGHRRIGIVTGPKWYTTAVERLEGYKRALADYNIKLDPELLWHGDYSMEGGRAGTEYLLGLSEPPTALLITNYHTTLGSLIMLNEKGIQMPEQLSFIGFEAIEVSRTMNPRPTMIRLPLEELGQKAADMLYSRIARQNDQPHWSIHRIRTELLEGYSIAKV